MQTGTHRKECCIMTITQDKNGSSLTLHIAGRIDTKTAPELEQTVRAALEGLTELTFDLKETAYISSAGLRVVVVAHPEMKKKDGLVLKNLSKNVQSIINLTGFNKALNIE